ncbi:hypothetical protein [Paenibacillus aceti]|uniref:DUF2628 domain-containing protein n=1 Tax=Paenibacillus aceti TaxID=1820010 RepID=A0ABQ1VZY8_9BACL|nr:hypothetical protein [Paenibacillus aceti]GGG07917.1 hypothetical protein GCM10010913_32130 [Paenibacillus aceti]
MFRAYTNRGKGWETLQSWWILLTLFPLGVASFLSFLYIGLRVKNWRWIIYGLVYLGGAIAVFATSEGVSAIIAITLWIVSIIHAIKVRSAFLIQLDVYKSGEKSREQQRIDRLRQEAQAKFQPSSFPSPTQLKPPAPKIKTEPNMRSFTGNDASPNESQQTEANPLHPANTSNTSHASDDSATKLSSSGNGRRVDV